MDTYNLTSIRRRDDSDTARDYDFTGSFQCSCPLYMEIIRESI